jgi:hypothetical protein
VTEYWQFDPRGEWIPEKLRGYRLQGTIEPTYFPITDGHSQSLQLQITVEDKTIAFHRLDNGEKLLPPAELDLALAKEVQRSKELEAQRCINNILVNCLLKILNCHSAMRADLPCDQSTYLVMVPTH